MVTGDSTGKLPNPPTSLQGPDSPTQLTRGSWWAVLKRTVSQFQADNLTDWAAALTYYSVQSLFPGILVLLSLLGLAGQRTTDRVIETITEVAPGSVRDLLNTAVENLQE